MSFLNVVPNQDNVFYWYDNATQEQIHRGEVFYEQANEQLRIRAPSLPLAFAAGAAAVLSPKLQWEANIDVLVQMINEGANGVYRAIGKIDKPMTSVGKAWRILNGEHPLSVLDPITSPKTYAFFYCLMLDPAFPVCDRHTISAAMSKEYLPSHAVTGWNKRKRYTIVENIYRAAAAHAGRLLPHFQAIVWIVYRDTFVEKLRIKIQGVN